MPRYAQPPPGGKVAPELKPGDVEAKPNGDSVDAKPNGGSGKPVRLVRSVVTRKIAVQPLRRLPVSRPYTTMNPEPIPTRLINT